MAGLGKVCTHVAAVLFFWKLQTGFKEELHAHKRMFEDKVIISKEYFVCYVKDLDFTSAKGRENMDGAMMDCTDDTTSAKRQRKLIWLVHQLQD